MNKEEKIEQFRSKLINITRSSMRNEESTIEIVDKLMKSLEEHNFFGVFDEEK